MGNHRTTARRQLILRPLRLTHYSSFPTLTSFSKPMGCLLALTIFKTPNNTCNPRHLSLVEDLVRPLQRASTARLATRPLPDAAICPDMVSYPHETSGMSLTTCRTDTHRCETSQMQLAQLWQAVYPALGAHCPHSSSHW